MDNLRQSSPRRDCKPISKESPYIRLPQRKDD